MAELANRSELTKERTDMSSFLSCFATKNNIKKSMKDDSENQQKRKKGGPLDET